MLAYILALFIALGSLALYMAAFFFPEIHRKNDFIWSGIGLFYALVLWVCAGRITGGVLLGQVASVALLGWASVQMLQLRRQLTPATQQTAVPSAEQVKTTIQQQVTKSSPRESLAQLPQKLGGIFTGVKDKIFRKKESAGQPQVTTTTTPAPEAKPVVEIIDQRDKTPEAPPEAVTTPTPETVPEQPPEAVTTPTPEAVPEAPPEVVTTPETETSTETVPELHRPNPPAPELVEAAIEAAEEAHEIAEEIAQIPLEEIAPDAELAPPAEAPPEQIPPTDTPPAT